MERATHEGFDIMTAPEVATLYFHSSYQPATLCTQPATLCVQVATLYFNSSYQLPSASSEDFMEQLFLFQKNVMKLQLQMERCFSELAGIVSKLGP